MRIDEDELIATIAEDTGTDDPDGARRALEVTVVALGASLDPAEADALAGELPARLADRVRAAARGAAPWTDDPFADLAAREGVPRGLAIEYAHVAGHALAARLAPEVVTLLGRRLPPPWRDLLHRRVIEPPAPPVHHAPPTGEGHTLATGRPGSHHAVADHGVADTHGHSLDREANPHGDSKLSTGAPSAEPVASGHPRRGRPISDADG